MSPSAEHADVAVIEGNRGLFDGMDAQGTYSTAELAKLLQAPVVLAVDCTKSTRTVAALVLGCQRLDPQVPIRGVILNQTAGPRHESVLREAIEQICGLPVLGAVARIPRAALSGKTSGPRAAPGTRPTGPRDRAGCRRGGAVPGPGGHLEPGPAGPGAGASTGRTARTPTAERRSKPPSRGSHRRVPGRGVSVLLSREPRGPGPRGREPDRDLSAARRGTCRTWTPCTSAAVFPRRWPPPWRRTSRSSTRLRRAIEKGLPVYAECGGAVFLGEKLVLRAEAVPHGGRAAGGLRLPARSRRGTATRCSKRSSTTRSTRVGESLRGHEFHYTYMQSSAAERSDLRLPRASRTRIRRPAGRPVPPQRAGLLHARARAGDRELGAVAGAGGGSVQLASLTFRRCSRPAEPLAIPRARPRHRGPGRECRQGFTGCGIAANRHPAYAFGRSVCGLIFSSAAAPRGPSIRPFVAAKANSMCLRTTASSGAISVELPD